MNVDGVITETRTITRDESYDDAWMVERLNSGIQEIAALFVIPGLSTSDTVSALTTINNVAMPSDFHRDLYLATTETYPNGLILSPNLKDLIAQTDQEETGDVRQVAVEFQTLYYAPVPSEAAETITLYYYKTPTAITLVSDLPAWIPVHLQRVLMVNYLAKEIFSQIEEGIDGQTPRTAMFSSLYAQALMLLERFYPHASKPKYQITSTPVWF